MVLIAGLVLARARVGSVRGKTVRLYALANEARGVFAGTDVWLDGQKIGVVTNIGFRGVTTDTLERLVLELQVKAKHRDHIRENSHVAIRSGGRLIGAPVIHISSGTTDSPVLAEGDTLHPAMQSDMETLTSELALAARDVKPIIENVKQIGALMSRSRERMTGARTDRGEVAISAVGRDARAFGERALSGQGTLGRLVRGDSGLMQRAEGLVARADSFANELENGNGNFARFRSDTLLVRHLASMRNELSIVRARLASADGTAGRVLHDSALVRQMQRREELLRQLIEDIKRDPGRYVAF